MRSSQRAANQSKVRSWMTSKSIGQLKYFISNFHKGLPVTKPLHLLQGSGYGTVAYHMVDKTEGILDDAVVSDSFNLKTSLFSSVFESESILTHQTI